MLKTEQQRINDAISVRKQLTQLGCTLSETNRAKVSYASNSFVKAGGNIVLKLSVSDETRVIVQFHDKLASQSGIILEYI